MFKSWLNRLRFRFWYWAYRKNHFKATLAHVIETLDATLFVRYKPNQGMKIRLSTTYPRIGLLIQGYLKAIQIIEEDTYIQNPISSLEQQSQTLDDWLITTEEITVSLGDALEAVQFHYRAFNDAILRKEKKDQPYFERQFYALTRDTEEFVKAISRVAA